MSELLDWMKEVYTKAKEHSFTWKPVYPNNMICNGMDGIYTDMFFRCGDTYDYIKFTIQYQSRCDWHGMSHPEEGTAFYILHEQELPGLKETFQIPEPFEETEWNFHDPEAANANRVNEYGRFRYAFADEETAKSVVVNELLSKIYPQGYFLDEAERNEWNSFIKSFGDEAHKVNEIGVLFQ